MKALKLKCGATNVIDFASKHASFRNPAYHFEVSSRMITPDADPIDYLKIFYMYLDLKQIDSVFGNAIYPSMFYGGRSYDLKHSLTDQHIRILNDYGKGVTFTMTNHHFHEDVYRANYHFLQRHHQKGNGIVCANDDLAQRIRVDFPDYTLKASLIKNLNTVEKVRFALSLYDSVVIPMDKNDDDDFLQQLPEKSRIVLFANANCAYNCAARTCYAAISLAQWGKGNKSNCSKSWLLRPDIGHIFFDIDKFAGMGFQYFKLVPHITTQAKDFLKFKTGSDESASKPSGQLPDNTMHLYSFPKCGRTWLRFLLAHYFNLAFKLQIPIDLQTLFTLLPNDHSGLKGVEYFQFDHIPGLPLIVSSHSLNQEQRSKGILLLRSIPDVVVSDYFQQQKLGSFEGSIADFTGSEKGSLRRYCRYLNTWAREQSYSGQHLLTYEGLHLDTASELKIILILLGLQPHDEYVQLAVEKSSFQHMQETEKTTGHAGMPSANCDQEMLKVRKGEVGGYVNYLSSEEIRILFKIADQLLSPQAKTMLESHGIGLEKVATLATPPF